MQQPDSEEEIHRPSGLQRIGFPTNKPQPRQKALKPLVNALTANGTFNVHADGFDLHGLLFMEIQNLSPCFQTKYIFSGQRTRYALVRLQLENCFKKTGDKRHVVIHAGDIALLDMNAPLVCHMETSRSLNLIVPHDTLSMSTKDGLLAYDRVICGNSPEGKVLGRQLRTIWEQLPKAKVTDIKSLNQMLLSSIVSAFDAGQPTAEKQTRPGGQASFERVSMYIDKHLHEPLDAKRLCQELSVSRDKLYDLFKSHGGVAHYIRTARLKRCLEDLVRIKDTSVRIGDVSSRWGFSSQSHFSRLFRATFGMTPNEAVRRGNCVRPVSFPRIVSGHPGFSSPQPAAYLS